MKCGYKLCDKPVARTKNGIARKFCVPRHSKLEYSRAKHERASGNIYLANLKDVVKEAREQNRQDLNKALQGNTESQEALKTRGLKYHFRRGEGEWGKERQSL